MMKWLLVGVGAIVALIAVVVLVGLMLPRKHRARRTVRYPYPAERVWSAISRFEAHPSWRAEVSRIERLEDRDGHPVWREVHARGDAIVMAVIELDPPRRMITKIVDNTLFGGTWTWEIEPAGEECSLTIIEDGEVYNPIFRFVSRFVMGHHATMDRLHADLGAYLDRGGGK